jgi:Ser/Thr protein kinase RdoA (MazF antagonist)
MRVSPVSFYFPVFDYSERFQSFRVSVFQCLVFSMVSPELAKILRCFDRLGTVVATAPLKTGHINTTYVVHTETPAGRRRFVLQQVNCRVFTNVPALMENVVRVTTHLRRKAANDRGAKVLSIVEASDGSSCVRDSRGEWWRLYDFIEGAHSVDKAANETQAREAARAFGQFQSHLADLGGARLHETIEKFHHTPSRVAALKAAVAADPLRRATDVRPEIDFALSRERDAHVLLDLLAAGHLIEQVSHNDTKINNVMLDDATGRAVAVVDLDTVMPGLALYDFGDLVRASASSTAEDDPEPANMHVVLPLFRALVEGWLEAGAAPTAKERELLPFAGKLIAYETGIRFLTDYLQGDVYFKVHHPEHNLHRARTQFALVSSIEKEAAALARIVEEVAQGLST